MSLYAKIHEWQTRLVLIEPNSDHSAYLELSLVTVDLVALSTGAIINHKTIVKYDALSYAWGTSLPTIPCACDGNEILLRDNLDSALRYLRLPHDERYVWIDFLCINQQDDQEKSVQIPLMRSIYSKASTVIVWLGESLSIENLLLHCNGKCGQEVKVLTCPSHKEQLWKCILEYTWFERTWVRQEVFAAKTLKICCPYFSSPWEIFTEALQLVAKSVPASSTKAFQNLMSLDQLYNDEFYANQTKRLHPEPELLTLLRQGKGFQASVAHDHVFSVLGMLHAAKHDTMPIPVTYDKTYAEICGDVTRFVIRKTQNISILIWCTLQNDRSYAFKWPLVEVSCPFCVEHIPTATTFERNREFVDWFDIENPIRDIGSRIPSEYSTPNASLRPLVLYGREWGTLSWQSGKDYNPHTKKWVDTYLAESAVVHDAGVHWIWPEKGDKYRKFTIFKWGFLRYAFEGGLKECWTKVGWQCCGTVMTGDVFASLEPGAYNVVLRRCLNKTTCMKL